ncbi:hypothetical protein [Longispora albida]|uniref:divisome protein SepX/GlpR n=1 Tax=Longispora albida TaxID=203523 RepID=UPI0003810FCC|nr:hypothetical protein [Longispora albida]
MPTSVLLAVLAAAGLLALAPALVRRYDATERLVAERAQSTARVVSRRRRRRTVPTRRGFPSPRPADAPPVTAGLSPAQLAARKAEKARLWRYRRRRRVLAALILLNVVELAGVAVFDPGLWIGFALSFTLLVAYAIRLRNQVISERKRRRRAAYLARMAAQREAARIERERAELRAAAEQAAAAARRGAAAYRSYRRRVAQATQEPRRLHPVRGAAYEARAVGW